MAKKYYWLKLQKDFFSQPIIKKLRRIAGGDTYTIIYLKMQLSSLENDGKIYYEGIEDTFAKELSLTLDEDADNIEVTLSFLQKYGLLEEISPDEFTLPETLENIGTETAGASRVRRFRQRQKTLLSNGVVTNSNTEKRREEKELELDKERETKEKDLSLGTTEILNFIEEKACISLSGQYQNIEELIKLYKLEDIKKAIVKTISKGKKGKNILDYSKGILQNWAIEGREYESGKATNTISKQNLTGGKYTGFKPKPPDTTGEIDETGLI